MVHVTEKRLVLHFIWTTGIL